MRYIYLNVFCIGMLIYAISLAANTTQEQEQPEQEEEQQPDYDKMIRDIERDAEVHSSWGDWGQRN